jgi:hypothetical protein
VRKKGEEGLPLDADIIQNKYYLRKGFFDV